MAFRIASLSKSQMLGLVSPLTVMLLMMWCSSGTLSGYAVSHHDALVIDRCSYLANLDHVHFIGPFKLLEGQPRVHWESSVMLRRILYPLFAYPAVSVFGELWGGFFFNAFLTLGTALIFFLVVRNYYGILIAERSLWILSTYPGIAYWVGLPYAHAAIVPCSLISFSLLLWVNSEISTFRVIISSLLIGLLFFFYDVLAFYGPALMCLLIFKRRWLLSLFTSVCLFTPVVVGISLIKRLLNVGLDDRNSNIFGRIINAYLQNFRLDEFLTALLALPQLMIKIFLASNFFIIPVAYVLLLGISFLRGKYKEAIVLPEFSVIVVGIFLFSFNNLAPQYEGYQIASHYVGYQLRGEWIARLYQPIFPALILALARSADRLSKVLPIVVLNGLIVFGPILHLQTADLAYYYFYKHSYPDAVSANVRKYGGRPLGFCLKKRDLDRRLSQQP